MNFSGRRLELNYASGAGGGIRVELQNRFTGDISLMADGALGSKFPVELVDQRSDAPVFGFRPENYAGWHRNTD